VDEHCYARAPSFSLCILQLLVGSSLPIDQGFQTSFGQEVSKQIYTRSLLFVIDKLVRNALFLQKGKGFLHRIAIFYAVNFHCFFPFNEFLSCFLHVLEGPCQSVHPSRQSIKRGFQTGMEPNKPLALTCFGNSDQKVGCQISLPIQNP
jgi:hypothetical protein